MGTAMYVSAFIYISVSTYVLECIQEFSESPSQCELNARMVLKFQRK